MIRNWWKFGACLTLLIAFAAAGPLFGGDRTMFRNMEILRDIEETPELASYPSLSIDNILLEVSLDDRLDADRAYGRPFVDELQEGMSRYLEKRGVRIAGADADLRIAATIDSYEGWKGWGRWGVDIALRVKIFRDGELLIEDELRSFLKYSDKREVEKEEEEKYSSQDETPARFLEILFSRVGIDLSEKLIILLKENRSALTGERKASPGKGVLSIAASVQNAEVMIDGGLIGTTPLTDIPLSAGAHVIEVGKEGYETWRREVVVLEGAASALVAELKAIE